MFRVVLTYHEVMNSGEVKSEEKMKLFSSKYTFDSIQFTKHVESISNAIKESSKDTSLIISFDDGRIGSYNIIADILDHFGIIGYFFVITDRIGMPGYMTRDQIRSLYHRGHVIGTHTCSHPARMSSLDRAILVKEWGESKEILSNIVGDEITSGAVPGGFYSRKVAQAASHVGIKQLFTSEPVTKCYYVDNCLIIGRFSVEKHVPLRDIVGIVKLRRYPRFKQFVLWQVKKLLKTLLGQKYGNVKKAVFALKG